MSVEILQAESKTKDTSDVSNLSSYKLSSFDSKHAMADELSILQIARNRSIEIIINRKEYREKKTYIGYFMSHLLSSLDASNAKSNPLKYLVRHSSIYSYLQSLVGMNAIFDPISIDRTQDLVHIIEAYSTILVVARTEDSYGLTQQYLPTFIYSLLALESEILEYIEVLRQVLILQRSRYIKQYSRLKAMTKSYIPGNIQGLLIVIDEALNRLCRSYYDIIPRYPFPQLYERRLQSRLKSYTLQRARKK